MKTAIRIILSVSALALVCSCQQKIYVSESGSDDNPGTKTKPLASIAKAMSVASAHDGPSTVYLREGRYELSEGISMVGSSAITVRPFRSEEVVISGGVRLDASDFSAITDEEVISRLSPEAREKALMLDLKERPELFHGVSAKGFGRKPAPSWSEILVDGKPMHLARWPKDREYMIQKVFCSGTTPKAGSGKPIKLPEIRLDNDDMYSFSGKEGLWAWGYFSASYAEDMLPVAAIDSVEHKMVLGLTTKYGASRNQDSIGHKRWAVMNVLEKMSEPGEFVLDSELKRMYFIPVSDRMDKLELSMLDTALFTMTDCSEIVFRDLTFQGGRSDGFILEGCSDCVLEDCVIRGLGRLAVHIGPGKESVRNGLRRCQVYDIGSGGVELFGGDRLSLTPGECFVEDCDIHNVNRMDKSYRPAVKFGECGNRVSHCELHDAPSMAILFNGNNQLIEYCDIHDVGKEISDQAAIYYGRNPTERGSKIMYTYIHEVHSGWKKWIFGIYHDDGACGVDVYGCVFNNIETSGVNIGGGNDISYRNCIFMNSPAALSIDDRNAINGKEGKYCTSYMKKFQNVKYKESPYADQYPELVNYYEEKPENPKRITVRDNLYFKVDRIWEAYVLYSRDFLDGYAKYPFDTASNPGLLDEDDPMKGLDMKKVRTIVPGFHEIPFEKIGIRK